MNRYLKVALFTALLALSAVPALAHGTGPAAEASDGPQYTPPQYELPKEKTPGPKAGLPDKAKAYGRRCKGESKKHVKGKKGTPFSRCVTALAKAASHKGMSPGQACKGTSHKHVKGEKGTPFSRCVKDVVEMRKQEKEEEQS